MMFVTVAVVSSAPSESESDHSASPPPVRRSSPDRDPSSKYKSVHF